jgi:hypothetical protein
MAAIDAERWLEARAHDAAQASAASIGSASRL